jgi:hypothetical protein
VKLVLEAVCILKGIKPVRGKDAQTGAMVDSYWDAAKKMLMVAGGLRAARGPGLRASGLGSRAQGLGLEALDLMPGDGRVGACGARGAWGSRHVAYKAHGVQGNRRTRRVGFMERGVKAAWG